MGLRRVAMATDTDDSVWGQVEFSGHAAQETVHLAILFLAGDWIGFASRNGLADNFDLLGFQSPEPRGRSPPCTT